MNEDTTKKSFIYNGQTVYYFVKDIEWKEIRGKEMASAFMVICDKNGTQNDFFAIYDERYKIIYATPVDAERWYIEYLTEKDK